jgi:hypothetical protein
MNMTTDTTPPFDSSGENAIDRASTIIAQSLAQALMEAEVIMAADRESRIPPVSPQVVDAPRRAHGVTG